MPRSVLALLALFLCTCVACGGTDAQPKKDADERPTAKEVRKQSGSRPAEDAPRAPFGPPARLASINIKGLDESSGIAASPKGEVFWTHNDSGEPLVYAFDRAGKARGTFRVTGARIYDWEDIATGPGPSAGMTYLYVGDIGDNRMRRGEIIIYRFPEPAHQADTEPAWAGVSPTEATEAIRLKYPDSAHDAEALMVHPKTGDIYIVTKTLGAPAGVYRLRAPFSSSTINTLERVGEVSVPSLFGGFITGGDISPDGRRVVLCDYVSAYELTLPEGSRSFEDAWKQRPLVIDLGERAQGEAVCYGPDGNTVYATSEKRPAPLIEVKRVK